jgi:uncharacterized membrane protein YgaE (UPF0421/DUF939 family)
MKENIQLNLLLVGSLISILANLDDWHQLSNQIVDHIRKEKSLSRKFSHISLKKNSRHRRTSKKEKHYTYRKQNKNIRSKSNKSTGSSNYITKSSLDVLSLNRTKEWTIRGILK